MLTNAVFWDMAECGSGKNRCFGGMVGVPEKIDIFGIK
jgi:hypothetical protein